MKIKHEHVLRTHFPAGLARIEQIPSSSMLARRTLGRVVAQPLPLAATPGNARNMATLREIELRLKSVRNIEKITKVRRCSGFYRACIDCSFQQSMKMIASTKLAKAQRAMQAGKQYGLANSGPCRIFPKHFSVLTDILHRGLRKYQRRVDRSTSKAVHCGLF